MELIQYPSQKDDELLIIGGNGLSGWFTKIWDFDSRKYIKEYPYQGKILDISPNSEHLVLINSYNLILIDIKNITSVSDIEKTLNSFSITPNPSQDNISINYTLSNSSYVNIDILDQEGILIENVINKYQNNGNYIEKYNTSNLTSGIYLCRIKTPYHTESVKFIIVK